MSMKQVVDEHTLLKIQMKELQENLQRMRENQMTMLANIRRRDSEQGNDFKEFLSFV